MADRFIDVIVPAESFALLTLDEVKLWSNIPSTDTANDAQLQQMIDWYSAYVSQITNRVFAKETVRETWFELQGRRLFLSHWPVDKADIQSVEAPEGAVLDPSSYRVEKESGKLALNDAPTLPVSVTYTGGYALPDEAPDDLKNATLLFVREGRIAAMREATTGLKSISHKDSRVMFNPTPTGLFGTGGSSSTDAIRAAHALVYHYGRLEV